MGDMADMALEQMYDYDDHFWGQNTAEGCGLRGCGGGHKPIMCNYCSSLDVVWRRDKTNRWRLFDTVNNKPHTCKEYYNKHRPRSCYTSREIVLTEPLPESNRTPYVPYLDWATQIMRQRAVEVARSV